MSCIWVVPLTTASTGFRNNGRAFIRSSDAGVTFTDMTWDATTKPPPPGTCCQPNPIAPNGMHPDSHAIVEVPGTDIAFFGGDGGILRSSGSFTNISSQCSARGLTGTNLATCVQMLSAVPTQLFTTYNDGLSTLQFQSVSINPSNANNLMGGTQDNGTFEKPSNSTTNWPQVIYGDGGQSGFNVGNTAFRFNSFTGELPRCELQEWRSNEVGHRQWSNCSERGGCAVLRSHHRRPRQCGNDFPRFSERLADSGLGWQPGIPGSQLP